MDNCAFFDDGIRFLPEEPAPAPRFVVGRARRWWVVLAATAVLMAGLVGMMIAGAVREHSRKQCVDNFRRLGLAFQGYHEAHGHFPAPALARSDRTPLLSWRVALLPHLGYRALYERFHLDEPWDSPHNRALLPEMPPELACPASAGSRDGRTGYLVVVGPEIDSYSVNTPFDARRGVDRREITDGTSATVLVFETEALVPWTKPDDLHWSPGSALPHLSSPHTGGAHAVFADGATRFLKDSTSPQILMAVLTINGGEITNA